LYFYIINSGLTGKEVKRRERGNPHTTQILRFFSYGKQSLEVGCFYSRPFFFYIPSSKFSSEADFVLCKEPLQRAQIAIYGTQAPLCGAHQALQRTQHLF